MRALDANIILRLIVNDDPHQASIAADVVRGPCWLSLTVLLEIAWVLQSRYRFDRTATAALLRGITQYDELEIEAVDAVQWCIDRFEQGEDIADLLHLAAARDRQAFATFDQGIAAAAGDAPPLVIETLA